MIYSYFFNYFSYVKQDASYIFTNHWTYNRSTKVIEYNKLLIFVDFEKTFWTQSNKPSC